jgi:polysaccharide export outer membrane protein
VLLGSRTPLTRTLDGVVIAVGCLIAGCGMVPTSGPTARQVINQSSNDGVARFAVVDIDGSVVAALRAAPKPSLSDRFPQRRAPFDPTIGIGDSVVVTLWEAADGGLFSASAAADGRAANGSHSVMLPPQTVGRDGAISVPFAGRVRVAGQLPVEVQHAIEARLTGKAIDPQAIVTVDRSVSNTATVEGEVVKGAILPLSAKGERLLDLIAAAGGAGAPVYEVAVRLSRGGVTVTIPMETLVADPTQNIYAEPGDVLTIVRAPQSFSVFGAAGQNNEIKFSAATLTLVEALAKAGGLQDFRSDPAGVFLFRYESPAVIDALGRTLGEVAPDGKVPVVYRLDLSDAKAYFAAERFPLEDKDILYVANADLTELQKFLGLINTLTGPAVTGAVIRNATQ